jgi:fumarylacetoacetase
MAMPMLNATHDPKLKSWINSANTPECDFPVQNLPFGVFSKGGGSPRVGVAIGDQVLDLAALETAGVVRPSTQAPVFANANLNAFMALGRKTWAETRARLSALLADGGDRTFRDDAALVARALLPMRDVILHMPIHVRGYTDFYASKEHATNVGAMFRDPKNALLPNWVHIPIGYNGRASTVVVSGTPVRRPLGQIKPLNSETLVFSRCRKLDFELEMGAIVGRANPMGETLSMDAARDAIFGFVLLNDWSARDIQAWEYVPLGPFQAKAFATSISPLVVTSEALEPFRVPGPSQSPEPLPYLRQSKPSNYDVNLEVGLQVQGHSDATRICRTNFKHMYWSSAQQLAHHAICGCAMEIGDLLGSGTISGASKDSLGSLLELTWNGANPLTLDGGTTRTFIEDGDEVVMSGWCQGQSYRIGFGAVRGSILPAHDVSQ